MADEIIAGEVWSYTVFGFGGQAQVKPGALQSLAQIVSGATQLIDSAVGPNSLSLRLRSTVNRARVADLKGDLDSGLQTLMSEGLIILPGATSTLNRISGASTAPAPGGGSKPGTSQPPPGSKAGPLSGIAASLGVSEETLWWALGGVALLLVLKK